jgi:SAM-dependent methyltransferase
VFPFSASALDDPPPWEYADQVRDAAVGARNALDLGTGGGERLAAMRALLPPRVVATEAWPPNVTVARAQLKPLGIDLVWYSPTALPFKDQVFDLVLSRHEEVTPSEVGRVLAPAGRFVTQQVGRSDWHEIHDHFERATTWEDHLSRYSSELRALGLQVETREHSRRVAYRSLADFVFLLAVTPWTVADFDVMADIDALRGLEAAYLGPEGLVLTEHRYLLVAAKPD